MKKEDALFRFDPISFVHKIDRGITMRTKAGELERLPERREVETTVTTKLGKAREIGGMRARHSSNDAEERKSKYRYLVVVERYKPDPVED